jgi:lipopolysaccharide export system permease protein
VTLHLYFARRFATAFAGILLVFAALITLLDMVEQLRRYESSDIGLPGALELALLAMPEALYRILPLIAVMTTIALFLGLARTSELVVARAAGRSALLTLAAPVAVAALIGAAAVALLNPIVAATTQSYEARAAALSNDGSSVLSVSPDGLWLRQGGAGGQTVIRAERANADGTLLSTVTFIEYAPIGADRQGPTRRIEAETARLADGAWALSNAKIWPLDSANPEAAAERHAALDLPSSLTRDQILDSFGSPAAVPIWDLPGYIEDLGAAGFSARLHRVWFQMELATPLFLATMVMLGASVTMRHTRFGRSGMLVMLALAMGFAVHFVRNFAQILGENGQIPVSLAAWAPPVAALFLSLGLLLHLEDG